MIKSNVNYSISTTMTGQSKLNNEAMVTDKMREMLDNVYLNDIKTAAKTEHYQRGGDHNMYVRITNANEQYMLMAETIVYGAVEGDAEQSSIELYDELVEQGKNPLIVRVVYDSKLMGEKDIATMVNIIHINGLFYVRDRADYTDQCKELGLWFLEREKDSNTKSCSVGKFKWTGDKERELTFYQRTFFIKRLIAENTMEINKRQMGNGFVPKPDNRDRNTHTRIYRKGKRIR